MTSPHFINWSIQNGALEPLDECPGYTKFKREGLKRKVPPVPPPKKNYKYNEYF